MDNDLPAFEDIFGKYDDRPMKGSWAPGEYSNKCLVCGDRFTGDKRAHSCADCAYSTTNHIEG